MVVIYASLFKIHNIHSLLILLFHRKHTDTVQDLGNRHKALNALVSNGYVFKQCSYWAVNSVMVLRRVAAKDATTVPL